MNATALVAFGAPILVAVLAYVGVRVFIARNPPVPDSAPRAGGQGDPR